MPIAAGVLEFARLHVPRSLTYARKHTTLRFTIDGRAPIVATKGVMVQVPYRTLYQIENVGAEPALRFEVNVARARKLYPMDERPVALPGFGPFQRTRLLRFSQRHSAERHYGYFNRKKRFPVAGVALRPATKIIQGDWPWHANRSITGDKSVWHNFKGKRRLNLLFGDSHVASSKLATVKDNPAVTPNVNGCVFTENAKLSFGDWW